MTTMIFDKLPTDWLRRMDLEETLNNSTTLQAVVGAGDLALEKLRDARSELMNRSASFDPKAFRDQAQASLVEKVEALQAEVRTAPAQLRSLPDLAQDLPTRAQSLFADVVSTAFSTYGELAGRGRALLGQLADEGLDYDDVAPVSRPAGDPQEPVVVSRPVTTASTPQASTAGTSTTKKATAKKSTPVKASTPAKASASAKKVPVAKTTTAKSTARKSTATKSTAKKSTPRTNTPRDGRAS